MRISTLTERSLIIHPFFFYFFISFDFTKNYKRVLLTVKKMSVFILLNIGPGITNKTILKASDNIAA